MTPDSLKIALRAPKLVLRFRCMVRSFIVSLQAGLCMVLTNEDMPLLFTRVVSATVRGASSEVLAADDGALAVRPPCGVGDGGGGGGVGAGVRYGCTLVCLLAVCGDRASPQCRPARSGLLNWSCVWRSRGRMWVPRPTPRAWNVLGCWPAHSGRGRFQFPEHGVGAVGGAVAVRLWLRGR